MGDLAWKAQQSEALQRALAKVAQDGESLWMLLQLPAAHSRSFPLKSSPQLGGGVVRPDHDKA